MGKKKTLKHKKLTDMRRQQPSHQEVSSSEQHTNTPSYAFTSVTNVKKSHSSTVVQKTVVTDVRKTALISVSIVALEVLLFVLLQNHVLALPFVRY